MKKITAILCALTLLLGLTAVVPLLPATAEDVARRPAANGQVAWLADFARENNDAWMSDVHDAVNGAFKGKLYDGSLMENPTDVSADGASAAIKSKAGNVVAMVGTSVAADFSVYTKLVIKATYIGDHFDAFRFGLHNGSHVTSNWRGEASVAMSPECTKGEDGKIFWIVDLAQFAGCDHMWINLGWFLNSTDTFKVDYMALTTDSVTDEATAAAAVTAYLAGEVVVRRPAANGQVAWLADFARENNDAWMSDVHDAVNGAFKGKLYDGALMANPTDVSADGASAAIKSKAGNVVAMVGTSVAADFSFYTKLVIKATYIGDHFDAFRFGLHNGSHVTSNWRGEASVAMSPECTKGEDGKIFWIVDLAQFAGCDHMWINLGWFLNSTDTFKVDYMALTTDSVTDEATAAAAIAAYLAGEAYVDPDAPRELAAKAFDAATDTKQAFITGALRLELSSNDIAKLSAADAKVKLTDGNNTLIWALKDYTLAEGKINTLMLPFTEASNVMLYAKESTRIDLTAVTGVSLTVSGADEELTAEIGKVDFVNFAELLDSVGIVFYDSANIPSVCNHPVVEGDRGGAYLLSNDVSPCEYVWDSIPAWARRFGAQGEKFSFNAQSRKRLDVEFRIKLEGEYDRFSVQMTSFTADGAYADQTWGIGIYPGDSIYDLTDGWVTISSADEDDADAWHFEGSNICDLTRLLNIRILGFRNPNTGAANNGRLWIDYMMITDSDRYEGLDNLYLYATANADGTGYVSPFEKEEPDESDEPSEEPSSDVSGETPNESSEETPGEASGETSGETPNESGNPDTGVALPITAVLVMAAAAGAAAVNRKKR